MDYLITGASGFLGGVLYNEVSKIHTAVGLGRSRVNKIQCDLSTSVPYIKEFDVIVHCAGLAHQSNSNQSEEYEAINVIGTKNLLRGLNHSPKQFIFISSVAVYGIDHGEFISEDGALSGSSPYAISKITAEEMVKEWSLNRGVKCLILRLPLIYGDNPPGNLAAMCKAMKKRRYFRIGKGNARKSWVQATEVAEFILNNPDLEGIYNLTSAHHPTLAEIENQIARDLNLPEPKSIPYGIAWLVANTFGRIPGFPLSLNRFLKLTTDLTYTSIHLKGVNGF